MRKLGYHTHQQLAEAIGVNRSSVSHWLAGRVGVPRPVAMLLRMLVAAQNRDFASGGALPSNLKVYQDGSVGPRHDP